MGGLGVLVLGNRVPVLLKGRRKAGACPSIPADDSVLLKRCHGSKVRAGGFFLLPAIFRMNLRKHILKPTEWRK